MEELRRKAYRRRLFNEQAGKLMARAPALKDEIAWRVDHLNAKWELVEQIMAPIARPVSDHQDVSAGEFIFCFIIVYCATRKKKKFILRV